ncbi:MAG: hypothetical protein N3B13_11420, partial [Deltaproteobacteria bacterium]|nr:hypothetical protein [Deltaproteobacteria bacterium]
MNKGKKKRLTYGLRADYPSISPDKKKVAFVKKDLYFSKIGILNLESGEIEYIYQSPDYAEISNLRYSPCSELIAFSMWYKNERDIYIIDVKDRKTERVTADVSIDLQPSFSPDGKRLYFASDRTGIYNIYEFEIDMRRLKRITNTLTGYFAPETGNNGRMYALIYSAKGYDVCELDIDKYEYGEQQLYRTERFPVIIGEPKEYVKSDYSSLPSVLPKSWKPYTGLSDAGEFYGIKLSGSDSIGRNSFDLNLSYAPERDKIFYYFGYGLRYFYPYLSFESYKDYYRLGEVQYINGNEVDYYEDNITLKFKAGFPLSSYKFHRSVDISYSYQFLRGERNYYFHPNDLVPVFPKEGNKASVGISYSFSSVRGYGKSISSEEGIRYIIDLKLYDTILGSAFELYSAEFGTAFFIKNPLFRRHVNAFQINYGLS